MARGTKQCAIDQFFSRENTPLTRLAADDNQELLAQHPDSAPTAATSTQLKIRFPRAPPQSSVQIGGINRQQYAELVKTYQSTLRKAQKEPKRIAAALKRQRKAAERKRKRGRSRTRRKGSVGPIGPIELDLEIPQRKPRSHEWGTRERETHNDRCERCSLGGQVVECFTCNSVWHRKCADSLPNKGPTLQYWQCDICVEEEIAEYGTSRDQLRPQQPALTTIDAETATEKAIQPTEESDESQEEESDLAIEDSETDEEWEDTTHSKPTATPATKIGGRRRRKRKKQKTINLDGSSDDDEDELNVNTESNTHSNNDKDHTKSDTVTNNITHHTIASRR